MIEPTNDRSTSVDRAGYDVAILGGGLAGLTLAKQLLDRNADLRLAVIEKRSFPATEATHKVGESTVEIGAHYFSETLGLKKHLTDHQLPKFGLRFFFKDAFQSLSEGTEVGTSEFFDAPSYQVDRGRLENHLADLVQQRGGTLLSESRLRQIDVGPGDTPHRLSYDRDGGSHELTAKWLVDASGRASFLQRKLDLGEDLGHDINAVWFRVDANIQIDRWCDDSDWSGQVGKVPRRWLSTNHLMGEGYWVWLIPLASGSTSIGIVADPRYHRLQSINSLDKAFDWLDEHEPDCFDSLQPHRDKVQDFLAIKKMSRGTRQVFSADRWALVGEAAAFLDPFYSPGSDFIAIGNTMTTRLIEADAAGESIDSLAPTLQSVFLTLFQNNLLTYRDQYGLFGNPRIMAVKFVWDYAVYWGFPALLYFNDKLTDVPFIQSLHKGVEEIRAMNIRMQQFFRDWYAVDPEVNAGAAFIDQSRIEMMTRLNAELRDAVDDETLRARFESNVQLIRDLMHETIARVRTSQPTIAGEPPTGVPGKSHLTGLFEALNL